MSNIKGSDLLPFIIILSIGVGKVNSETKSYKDTVVLVLYSTILVLASLFVPLVGVFTTFVWFVPLVILTIKNGFKNSLIGSIIMFFIISILSLPQNTFMFFIQYVPVALIYCYLFEKKADFKTLISSGLIVSILSSAFRILFMVFVLDIDYSKWLNSMKKMADETVEFYKTSGLWEQISKGPIKPEDFKEMIYSFSELMANITPAILVTFGLLYAFISLLFTIRILKKKDLPVAEVTSFTKWKLPWQMVWIAIIALSSLLLGDFFGNKILLIIGQNIVYILVPFFLLSGFSAAVYFLKKWNLSIIFKIILVAIIVFNFPLFLVLILLLGLFDPLVNLRKI